MVFAYVFLSGKLADPDLLPLVFIIVFCLQAVIKKGLSLGCFSIDYDSYRNGVCEQDVDGGYESNDTSVWGKTWSLCVFPLMCRNIDIRGVIFIHFSFK